MSDKEVGYFKIEEKALRADKIHAKTLEEIKNFLKQSGTVREKIGPETLTDMTNKITALAKTLEATINEKVANKKFGVDNYEMSDDAYVQELGKMASKRINDAIKAFIADPVATDIAAFLEEVNTAIKTASKTDVEYDKMYGRNKDGTNPVT